MQVLNNHSTLLLDQEGILWLNKEDGTHFQFSSLPDDHIVCFDAITIKGELEVVVFGSENGTLQILNKNGSLQKEVKEAHKGTVIYIRISHDQ